MAKTTTKELIVSGTAHYKGVMILQTQIGIVLFIGTAMYTFADLPQATAFIDRWYELKRN